ncbi:MAG: polyphosphate--glucose phosphotransferase [Rubrobacteraceae bacterium]
MNTFGLDIGGSGIKGAPVDTQSGELLAERVRIPTPRDSGPEAMVETSLEVIRSFDWDGPVGVGFPGVMKDGVIHTAANVERALIGFDLEGRLRDELGADIHVVNDADAAGLAEMRWGAGREAEGVALMLTLGTGIGTALFTNGNLVPNTELGHIEIRGREAEHRASDHVRKDEGLGWKKWSKRLNEYLAAMEALFWPDLIIVGGGVSKKGDKFIPKLETRAKIVPAKMLNIAGIAGAALAPEAAPRKAEPG